MAVSAGCAIINADDAYAEFWTDMNAHRRVITFGLAENADVRGLGIEQDADGNQLFQLVTPLGQADVRLPLLGRHNVMNALAAAAAVTALDFEPAVIARGLANPAMVAGRLTRLPGRAGSRLIDDSYNANPGSLKAALEALVAQAGRPWLVLGDMGELGDTAVALHSAAGEQARALGVERLYAVGELSRHAIDAFGAGGVHCDSMEALIERLQDDLGEGVVILIKGSRGARMERVTTALRAEEA